MVIARFETACYKYNMNKILMNIINEILFLILINKKNVNAISRKLSYSTRTFEN